MSTPEWISIADLARARGCSYQAVRQMILRIETTAGREVTAWRLTTTRDGRRWRVRCVSTAALQREVELDRGTPQADPEVSKLKSEVDEMQQLVAAMARHVFGPGVHVTSGAL